MAQLQARQAALQTSLPALVETGTAAGGQVNVKINGRGELLSVGIDPALMVASRREELEALIVAAARLARTRIDQAIERASADVAS